MIKMDNIEIFDRIPTATHPLEKHYMLPITQFLYQWIHDETFYIDFVDFCPFNRELTIYFCAQRFSSPVHKNWATLFQHFQTNYSAKELSDLIYEVLHDLNQHEHYLHFLINHHYNYMWPTGENFCDPNLPIPIKPFLKK